MKFSKIIAAGLSFAAAFLIACGDDSSTQANEASEQGNTSNVGSEMFTYRTTTIGSQVWMAENLNEETVGSRCYDNNPAKCASYGRLYNWKDAQNVCSRGWHLPTKEDFETLLAHVGESDAERFYNLLATHSWRIPNEEEYLAHLDYKEDYQRLLKWELRTDPFGFSALPAGLSLVYDGTVDEEFSGVDGSAYFWTSTENDNGGAYVFRLSYDGVDLFGREYFSIEIGSSAKNSKMSVRCLMD